MLSGVRCRRRRSRAPSLLDSALNGKWQVSAVLAGLGSFITAVVLPRTLGSHKLLGPLAGMFQSLGWLFTGIFALIAVVKLATQATAGSEAMPVTVELSKATTAVPKPPQTHPASLDHTWGGPVETAKQELQDWPTDWSLKLLREIEWKRFEELVAAYFREAGYKVETIRCGADGGVDAKIYRDGDLIAIVQCKAWNTRLVGVKPVRDTFESRSETGDTKTISCDD